MVTVQYRKPVADADAAAILSLVFAFLLPPLGFALGLISEGDARRKGFQPSQAAQWGTVLGLMFTVLAVVLIAAYIAGG